MKDVTAPKTVEVAVSANGDRVWVNVDMECAFRACQISELIVTDDRPRVLLNTLEFSRETWDDPGGKPGEPLQSFAYAVVEGDVTVYGDFDLDSLVPVGFRVTEWKKEVEADDGTRRFYVSECRLEEPDGLALPEE